MYDLTIRGGNIVDGTRAALFIGVIAVSGGQALVEPINFEPRAEDTIAGLAEAAGCTASTGRPRWRVPR